MRWTAIVACGLLLVSACHRGDADEDEGPPVASRVDAKGRVVLSSEEREALGLQTTAVHRGTLTTSALRFGKVVARPQEDALVVAPVTGRLTAPLSVLGAKVAKGDPLVVIKPLLDTASRASLETQRRELAGQIAIARLQVKARKSELDRTSTLVSSGLATHAALARAKAALESERARVESLRLASDELRHATGGRMKLSAPISGVVATLETDRGSRVEQGSVVAQIIRAGPRWIDLAVPPGDPVGSGYQVEGFPGSSTARLLVRGAVIRPDGTRRDRLVTDVEASVNLPPGATVAVRVLHKARGILVPIQAIVRRGRQELVFVQVAEGRYAPSRVQVGARGEKRAAVTSGLSPGDRVVTRGTTALLGELAEAPAADRTRAP